LISTPDDHVVIISATPQLATTITLDRLEVRLLAGSMCRIGVARPW